VNRFTYGHEQTGKLYGNKIKNSSSSSRIAFETCRGMGSGKKGIPYRKADHGLLFRDNSSWMDIIKFLKGIDRQ
jgi:hypothetical protein